jgi:hypothetical protein
MKLKRLNWVAAVVFAALGMACISHLQAEDPEKGQRIPEIVKEAELAFRSTQAQYQFQQATVEDMYRWSRRWMEAELAHETNKKAVFDHLARMRDLNKKVEVLFKIGANGGQADYVHATRYYLLEAEAEVLKQAK